MLSSSLYRRTRDDRGRLRERQRQTKVSPPDLVIFINKSFLYPRVLNSVRVFLSFCFCKLKFAVCGDYELLSVPGGGGIRLLIHEPHRNSVKV